MDLVTNLSNEFKLKNEHVGNIVALIDAGSTIPFIARYRKEMTGSCDDQVLHALSDRLEYLRNLEKRKAEIQAGITELGLMTQELQASIDAAATMSEVEDLYRPYRPKRRTRATIALGKGLRPLADLLMKQELRRGSLQDIAMPYVDSRKEVESWEDAIAGARDILAEDISDNADMRRRLREIMQRDGLLRSTAGKKQDPVYDMYRDYSEPVARIPGHRILAVNRGEREDVLKIGIELNNEAVLATIYAAFVRPGSVTSECVREAAEDAWSRLIQPSIEREVRSALTARASDQAISLFALNLKPLLLQPPVKGRTVLGLDPAYRTGCKVAVVDANGRVLDTAVVYPTPPQNRVEEAKATLRKLIRKHGVSVISIGNGTASKESEIFVAELIREEDSGLSYMMVNEAGASVYSASKLAAAEFPELDVSLRSAVSIARRLQDPLAELVKIDPKSIGVGQYQHDMPTAQLDKALSAVVEGCVNSVGVDLNTASAPLLTYVSGMSASVAKNVVAFRDENGGFTSRAELKKVPKLGPKAFEQCAGFLRIPGGKNVLDNTSVHPESYDAAKTLLDLLGLKLSDVGEKGQAKLQERMSGIDGPAAAEACGIGIPTLRDIMAELQRPGRDIRDELPPPMLRTDVMDMNDLQPGMRLTGTVRNVIDFGVFVDIGVHQDGLVHVSELADRFVRHPSEVVKVGDVVTVHVLSVDKQKKRISLTMKSRGSLS